MGRGEAAFEGTPGCRCDIARRHHSFARPSGARWIRQRPSRGAQRDGYKRRKRLIRVGVKSAAELDRVSATSYERHRLLDRLADNFVPPEADVIGIMTAGATLQLRGAVGRCPEGGTTGRHRAVTDDDSVRIEAAVLNDVAGARPGSGLCIRCRRLRREADEE